MRRRFRELIGASVMIAFVSVYTLVAMALAQARPAPEAGVLIQLLARGVDRAGDAADQTDGENPIRERDFGVRFVVKPHPNRGSAATQPAGQ